MTTASVWPVTGTGDGGMGIEICAPRTVSSAPAKTSAMSRAHVPGIASASTAAGRWEYAAVLKVFMAPGRGEEGRGPYSVTAIHDLPVDDRELDRAGRAARPTGSRPGPRRTR